MNNGGFGRILFYRDGKNRHLGLSRWYELAVLTWRFCRAKYKSSLDLIFRLLSNGV